MGWNAFIEGLARLAALLLEVPEHAPGTLEIFDHISAQSGFCSASLLCPLHSYCSHRDSAASMDLTQ